MIQRFRLSLLSRVGPSPGGDPFCITLPILAPLPIGWVSIYGDLDTVAVHALIGAVSGAILGGGIGAIVGAIAAAGTAVEYEVYLFERMPPECCPCYPC